MSIRLSAEDWTALQGDVRAKRRTVLMQPCGAPGIVKTSKLGTQFFAHKPGRSDCGVEHPGETPLHLAAKVEILHGCADAGWDAEPEHRGDGWVADVHATNGTWRLAFEVQVTQQVHSEYARRQIRYQASGVRAAWLVKHPGSVLAPNPALPTFLLEEAEDGLHARLGDHRLPLRHATSLLVSGRAPFRSHLSSDQPTQINVQIAESDACWKCKKRYWLWQVAGETATGNCGQTAESDQTGGMWEMDKPEAAPNVVQAVRNAMTGDPLPVAKISMQRSQTVGHSYMAFFCPHCKGIYGDFYLSGFWASVAYGQPDRTISVPGTVRGVPHPHYCVDLTGTGTCPKPPASVVAADEAAHEKRTAVPVTTARVITQPVDIHQAVRRMLGGYRG